MRGNVIRSLLLIVCLCAASLPDSLAKLKEPADKNPAFAVPELAVLDRFSGPWEVKESHFNKRGEVVATARGTEEGTWVLDRRTLRRTYTTGEEGSLYRAVGLISWDAGAKKYRGMWFDNTSANGPTTLAGSWDEAARAMTYSLYASDAEAKPVEFKVIDKFVEDERRVATTYRVTGGAIEKVIEVEYVRARPCPSNLGVIMEGKPAERE